MIIATASLAALWGWFVLQFRHSIPPITWIRRAILALPKGDELLGCPWCLGGWFSILGVVLQGDFNLVHWLAAAGLTGLLATFLPDIDDGEPT